MTDVKRAGIDLGKQVFHLTAADGAGRVLERARLRRAGLRLRMAQLPPGTVVAMEACGSAWRCATAGRRPTSRTASCWSGASSRKGGSGRRSGGCRGSWRTRRAS